MKPVLVDSSAWVEFLRRKGSQVAILDLWIAVAAAYEGVPLLTLDADFERISKVVQVDRVIVA